MCTIDVGVKKGEKRTFESIKGSLFYRLDTVATTMTTTVITLSHKEQTSNKKYLKQPQFKHVRALVVSSIGAGSSSIIVGMGIGKLISHHLKHVLADHTGQEAAFSEIQNQTTVVRPTSLTEDQPTGKLAYFGEKAKGPSIKTDRADLAVWVAQEVCSSDKESRVVNVTSVKKYLVARWHLTFLRECERGNE